MRRRPTSLAGAPRPRPRRRSLPAVQGTPWLRRILWAAGFALVVSGLLWLLWPVFAILVAAAGLAYILDPLVDRFEARGLSRELGIGILLVSFLGLAALCLLVMMPPFLRKLGEIGVLMQDFFSSLDVRLAPIAAWIEQQTGRAVPLKLDDLQEQAPLWIQDGLPKIQGTATDAVKGLFTRGLGVINAVVNLTLLPLFVFYLLRDWDKLVATVADLVPRMLRPRVTRVALEVDERLSAFVRGQLTVCLILGVLYSLGLWIAGIDLPFTVGMLSGALFIIPYLGTAVGVVLAALLSLVEYGFDLHLLWIGLVFGGVQLLEGSVITPKVVGDKVGLHPLVVIIALIVGGSLLGIWGMLLAIPVTATLSVLGAEWIELYRDSSVYQEGQRPEPAE